MLGDEILNIFEIMVSRFEALKLNTSLGFKIPFHWIHKCTYIFSLICQLRNLVKPCVNHLGLQKMCLFLCEKVGRYLFWSKNLKYETHRKIGAYRRVALLSIYLDVILSVAVFLKQFSVNLFTL